MHLFYDQGKDGLSTGCLTRPPAVANVPKLTPQDLAHLEEHFRTNEVFRRHLTCSKYPANKRMKPGPVNVALLGDRGEFIDEGRVEFDG